LRSSNSNCKFGDFDAGYVFGVRCSVFYLANSHSKKHIIGEKERLEVLQGGPGNRKHSFCRADVILYSGSLGGFFEPSLRVKVLVDSPFPYGNNDDITTRRLKKIPRTG